MTIVVPTDFSDCANGAFKMACLVAKQTNSKLHIIHAIDQNDAWASLPEVEKYQAVAHESIAAAANKQLLALQAEAEAKGIDCEVHISQERFLEGLYDLVDLVKADLVVIGSHGASGKKEWLIGSNAQKAVRALRTKLLVIKEARPTLDFSHVLFASGLIEEDKIAFQQLLDFLKPFKVAHIHILAIRTGSFFGPPAVVMREALKDFAAMVDHYPCTTHYYEDLSIEAGIRDFINEHNIQCVALSNHRRQPLKRFFQGSTVEMLVNHADTPVLTIDYSEE